MAKAELLLPPRTVRPGCTALLLAAIGLLGTLGPDPCRSRRRQRRGIAAGSVDDLRVVPAWCDCSSWVQQCKQHQHTRSYKTPWHLCSQQHCLFELLRTPLVIDLRANINKFILHCTPLNDTVPFCR